MDHARGLFEDGYCIADLTQTQSALLRETLELARVFFCLPHEEKMKDFLSNHLLGYRPSGIEFSKYRTRPDLNDSVSICCGWRRDLPTTASFSLYETAEKLIVTLDQLAQQYLLSVAQRYGQTDAPETLSRSWLQINSYNVADNKRRMVLQDKHEDGHLLTLWHCQQPGLEIFPRTSDASVPVSLSQSQVMVMPGTMMDRLTGSDVRPLYHRVVRVADSRERISLMYFVNPTISKPLRQYQPRLRGSEEDIAALGVINPSRFGLPIV